MIELKPSTMKAVTPSRASAMSLGCWVPPETPTRAGRRTGGVGAAAGDRVTGLTQLLAESTT